ncbi:hypothetical protein AB0F15_37320 [Amycolatopsis sp. NPDC026612]|uniref:hypothetical protein n=1 Tax=Amycolatopsis sp. NPDC026612 TaxID=3155466 RepID=UPI0033E635FD
MTKLVSFDLTRRVADVVLTDAPAVLVASGLDAASVLEEALLFRAGVLASEQTGIAE